MAMKAEEIYANRKCSEIQPKEVDWLWPKWVPLGKLCICDGDPGLGKSTMLLDLAARISRDGIMPDSSVGLSGAVVILSAEDAADDTIRPRLDAAGANLDRIIDLTTLRKGDRPFPIELPRDIDHLRTVVESHEARLLIIIDPLLAFLVGADANKDQEIRRVMHQLSLMAESCRCAIIASIGVIGHARTGLLVAEDPEDDHKRILAVSKCNLAERPQALRFALEPTGSVCRISWIAAPDSKVAIVEANP